MTGAEWGVLTGSIGLIGAVNWWFFAADRGTATATAAAGGRQEATVIVDGGYAPGTVALAANQPATLRFDRRDTGGCSEEVVFADLGIRRFLPTGETTAIELPALAPGEYVFTCGMRMLKGRIVVTATGGSNVRHDH